MLVIYSSTNVVVGTQVDPDLLSTTMEAAVERVLT